MNPKPEHGRWAIARLLFTTHLPFLVILWLAFALILFGIIGSLALFSTVTTSIWDFSPMVLRWAALYYGIYLTKDMLPLYIAHGQSRHDFMRQVPLFLIVATAVFALLMVLGYAMEGILYQAMGWTQSISQYRLFTTPDQVVPLFWSYWLLFLGLILVGAIGAAGFNRSQEWGTATFLTALVLALMVLFAADGGEIPFLRRLSIFTDIPIEIGSVFGVAIVVVGFAILWGVIREIPIRIQSL